MKHIATGRPAVKTTAQNHGNSQGLAPYRTFLKVVVYLALPLGGCGVDDRDSDPNIVRIDTTATGTVVVRNQGPGEWDSRSRWRVREQFRIGSVDGGPTEFDAIFDILPGPAGGFYVLLTRRQEVLLFDSSGEFAQGLGRSGQGPGEFVWPSSADVDPTSGRLWVADPRNLRYTVFDTLGRFVEDHRRNSALAAIPASSRLRFDSLGRMYDGDFLAFATDGFRTRIFRLDSTLQPADSVVFLGGHRPPGDDAGRPGPYAPQQLFRFDRGGFVWYVRTDQYRLLKLDFNGDTVLMIEREVQPEPIAASERSRLLQRQEEFLRAIGSRSALATHVPDFRPPVTDLAIDEEGYLWVARSNSEDGVVRSFDVFHPTGRYLGTADVDHAVAVNRAGIAGVFRGEPLTFAAGVLYSLEFDEWDVPYVVRSVIERPFSQH